MDKEIQAQVETGETLFDIGYDPFCYNSKEEEDRAIQKLVDAINANKDNYERIISSNV